MKNKKTKDSSKNRRTDSINKNLDLPKEVLLVALGGNEYFKSFEKFVIVFLGDSFSSCLAAWLDEQYWSLAVVLRDLKISVDLSELQAYTLVLHQLFAVPRVVLAKTRGCDPANINRSFAHGVLKLTRVGSYSRFLESVYSESFVEFKVSFEVFVRQEAKKRGVLVD